MLDSSNKLPLPIFRSSSALAFDKDSGLRSNSAIAHSSVLDVVSVPATNRTCFTNCELESNADENSERD